MIQLDRMFRAEVERLTSHAAVAYQLYHATRFGLAGFVTSAAEVTAQIEKKVGTLCRIEQTIVPTVFHLGSQGAKLVPTGYFNHMKTVSRIIAIYKKRWEGKPRNRHFSSGGLK